MPALCTLRAAVQEEERGPFLLASEARRDILLNLICVKSHLWQYLAARGGGCVPLYNPKRDECTAIDAFSVRGHSRRRRVITCLVVGMSLLSCSRAVRAPEWPASDPRCRQRPETAPPAPVDPQKPAAWVAKTYDLLARGRYTPPFQDDSGAIGNDTGAVPATVLTLEQLGLSPGDYVGFRIKGGWMGGQGDAVHADTGVVFQNADGTALKPANFGQEQPFHFGGPNGGPPYAEVDNDFRVDANQPVYVRVPNNARKIAFSAVDWFVTDNCPPAVEHSWAHYDCPSLAYQVTVSEPNRPPGRSPSPRDTEEADEELVGRVATGMDPATFPEAEGFSAGPFSVNADPATDGQWRGNYPKGWNPSSSKFRGNRAASTSKRHWGWDIFAPFDTKLIAPVWPAQLHFMSTPAKSGYGPIAVLGFKYHGTPWLLMYAHLNAFEGADRRISSAEVIARAGCGGNANDAGCSAPLASGGRTNHVHVGLMRLQKNEAVVADDYACDPAMVLNWSIR